MRSYQVPCIRKLRMLYLLVFILGTGFAHAQNFRFTASVDNDHVSTSDQIQLTFTLDGQGGGNGFTPPPLNDFFVLGGPNQSTNMQIVNGSVSSSVTFTYAIQPKAAGKFTIGAASIQAGGTTLKSNPIDITVTKGAPQPKAGAGAAAQPSGGDVNKQIADNLFLRAAVDKPRAFQGEQITVTYKIYTRVSIANYTMDKEPALTGFWSEDLDVPKQIQLTNETIDGKQYKVGILKKVAVFPQKSGTLTIDPMEVTCVVQVRTQQRSGGSVFDQFFNDPFFGGVQNVNHVVKSDAVKLNVLPLPSENVPAGFNGAVGKFTMEAWLDKSQTKTNEAVTLRVKITGSGNLKLLEAPSLVIPPDLDKFDPKISDNISNANGIISGSRTFEFLLIPRHPGDQKISSFPFAYYDPEKKNYVAMQSSDFPLTVAQGTDVGGGAVTSGISKEDVKLLGEDIRFIKSGNVALHKKGAQLAGTPIFYAATVSPFFAFIGFVFYLRRREKMLGDVRGMRTRKARKMAQKRLEESKKLHDAKKKEEFYTSISKALWGYAGDKLGIPPSDLTSDTVKTALEGRGVAPELTAKLLSTIEQCEFARFAPGQDVQMDTMYADSVELISQIEGQIR